jgi:HTH-type transcriptional regulator / antitoxin HipB
MRKYKDTTPKLNALLNDLTEEEIETGILKSSNVPIDERMFPEVSFEEFKAMLEEAIVVKHVTEALEQARKEKNLTLEEVGRRVGVSRARIKQLETSENIEISTLVRVASAMGYKVQIALTSEDGKVFIARS